MIDCYNLGFQEGEGLKGGSMGGIVYSSTPVDHDIIW